MHLTIPKAFIRYVGNSLHPTDYTRSDVWVQRMKYWLDHGLQELYFFMHMHDEATSPELTVYLVDKLNKECGLNLIKPKFIEEHQPKRIFKKDCLINLLHIAHPILLYISGFVRFLPHFPISCSAACCKF